MLTFGAPAFLVAGALAALVPLVLHLIRRRPPMRSPLPTARFLEEDARSSVRISRPTDRVLMALRILLLLVVGAALARPAWVPAPDGTRELVLLDRSVAMRDGDAWRRGVAEARRILLAPDGGARGDLILFDTAAFRIAAGRITAVTFDSLAAARPAAQPPRYAAALRAIVPAARELHGADSVRVTMLSALRWTGWSPGMAALREAAWPGAIRVRELGAPVPRPPFTPEPERGEVIVLAGEGEGRFVTPALEATGWRVRRVVGLAGQSGAQLVVSMRPVGPELRAFAEAGATVVVDSRAAGDWLPVEVSAGARTDAGELWFGPDLRLAGAAQRVSLRAKPGTSVLAWWDDGRPGVVAARVGRGCVVYVGAPLEGGDLPLSSAYPRALERMAQGCDPAEASDARVPLDAGARAVLAGRGPAAVHAGATGGVALGRWLVAAALAVALAETWLAYRRRAAA